ncbi:MAG: 50S ribosome-binding GTPase [Sulfuricurvum sp.]|nr:50S ribosome-binding GTPase [Sulfuricurvum sp.]MDD5385892.1 50S ribosome-binding GTPase [Sulfuricurvum sp.]
MNQTLDEFKKQQNGAMEILNKLKDFLEVGEKIGVEIDGSLKSKLFNALNEIATTKLKVALIGGFSEGKTSIAAAWMEKLDKSNMKITHQESSDEVSVYEVGNDIELVDTPGLFGFKEKYNADSQSIEKYKDITQKYISEAHLVLYVMNSVNPIKESHKEDLQWLFRTLNLLPRTIFVLSRFDEVADVEDEISYQNEAKIKKENVLDRLKDLIYLTDEESSELSIIAVSANPFDMGMAHWLSNLETFKKLSHISNLQNATSEKIKHSGGVAKIVNETKKTIIQDVLEKQLPASQELNLKIEQEVNKLTEISQVINKNVQSLEPKISEVRINLREFISEYFTDLILQAKGTSLETVSHFIEKEIGSEGINLNTKIQNEFERQIGAVSFELQKIETNFNAEIDSFNQTIKSYGKQGVSYLSKSGVINKDNVLLVRDAIVTGAKTLGLDLSKYLKFKPWGATKLANGVSGAIAFIGLALEVWDSYDNHQKEKAFQEFINGKNKEKGGNRTDDDFGMIENFEKQRKEILETINGNEFISNFFPTYIDLQNKLQSIQNDIIEMNKQQKAFKEWVEMGEVIDVEFSEIKQLT